MRANTRADAERLTARSRHDDVAVVTVRHCGQRNGPFHPGTAQGGSVVADPLDLLGVEPGETPERRPVRVDDGHGVAERQQTFGETGADAPAPHDHHVAARARRVLRWMVASRSRHLFACFDTV